MAQQTAIEFFYDKILNIEVNFDDGNLIDKYFKISKAMEKEQIMKAVDRGYDEGCKFPEDMTLKSAEQYYNETYNK